MRIPFFVAVATLGLSACGGADNGDSATDGNPDAQSFIEQYEDKFCEEYRACTLETSCLLTQQTPQPGGPGGTQPQTTTENCVFDQVAADNCLEGEWGCVYFGAFGQEFVVPPPACCAVCGGLPCQTSGP